MEDRMLESDNNRNLLVIKASAGSGKTYRLAQEYIRHLLFTRAEDGTLMPRRTAGDTRQLNAHRQLLAITFTNKATDEMKERIVAELYNLSQPDTRSDYLAGFIDETGLSEDAMRDLARQALNELLFDYSYFNVSTIDSFFQTILRNFARELDRDFNYDIQLEEDYAVRVAVHKFLLALGREGMPTQVNDWVQDYQRHLIRGDAERKNWKFFDDGGDLNKFAKQINTELFRDSMEDIRKYLGRVEDGVFRPDFSRIRRFEHSMAEVVKRIEDEVQLTMDELKAALQPLASTLWTGRSFHSFMAKDGTEPLPKKSWEEITEKKVLNQFGKNKPDEVTVNRLMDLVARHFRAREEIGFFRHIRDNLGLLGMLAMIDLFLEDYRHETNTILIGDTNELIGTVLASGSDFVYERVGTTIAHFMIDEFQDTSSKQYENFKELIRESLSHKHFNMLIGDAKQSIYRFRNVDPTVFRDKVERDFGPYITDGRQPSDDDADGSQPSSVNYRSSRHIIDFNNRLFVFMRNLFGDRPTVVSTYADIVQAMPDNIDNDKVPGYVRLMTGNYRGCLNDPLVATTLPPDFEQPAGDDADVDVLTVLPGYLLKLHERYDWKSIGILVNKNKEGDKIVDCILNYNKRTTGEKINIVSGESLLLNNSPIIRRIIAMLRFIDISQYGAVEEDADDTDERDSLARRIAAKRESDRRLYTSLSRFIKALADHPDASPRENGLLLSQSLATTTPDEEDLSRDDLLEHLLPPAGELTTLVSIVETIIAHFKNDQASASGGKRGDVDREAAFLLAFQDAVMQFSSMRNGGSVREFLKYWDEKKGTLAVNSASNDDAIEIMSIHKAKGLEFDCVVIPYADWELDGNSRERAYWMPRGVFRDVLHSLDDETYQQLDVDDVPPLLHVDKASTVNLFNDRRLGAQASAFVAKQVDDVLIDNLNKTYVAMTRPRSELHVFAKGKDSSVAGPLAQFASQGGALAPMAMVQDWYEMGVPPTRDDFEALREAKRRAKALKPGRDTRREVSHEIIGGYTVNDVPVQLQVNVENASSPRIKAGIRLHSLLSQIRDRNDVDRVIASGIKHGTITDDPSDPCSIDSINSHVRGPIMADAGRVAAWFDPVNKVYSERTITSASDSLWDEDGIENLRPDRIIRRPDGTMLVIDYKSGNRCDKDYLSKMNRYIAKLRLIFPGVPIAGRIWYVTHDLILDEKGQKMKVQD